MFSKISKQLPSINNQDDTLSTFYVRMSAILFKFSVFLLTPALFVGSYFYFSTGYIVYGVLEIAVGLFLVFIVYFDRINYEVKRNIILTLYYLFAFFVLITTGTEGGGFSSLFVTILFISLLNKNNKVLWRLFLVNTILLVIVSALLYAGFLDGEKIATYKETWLFLFFLITVYTLGVLYAVAYYKNTIQNQFSASNKKRLFLDNIVNGMHDSLVTIDNTGIITLANTNFADLFYTEKELVGRKYDVVLKSYLEKHPDNRSIEHNILDHQFENGDYYIPHKDGTLYLFRRIFSLTHEDGSEERIIVITDITERKKNEEKLKHLSFHDQLTGLYNRRFFEVELERLNSKRSLPLTLVMIDVNGLKLINDSFGHQIGDQVLKEAANCIKCCTRDVDVVARIGGDEFAIILPNVSGKNVRILERRIQDKAKDITIEGIPLSFSIGSGTKTKEEEGIADIYRTMEDELYRNKLWESQSMRNSTIELILQTLYEKNNREMNHSRRVSSLSEKLAKLLHLSDAEVEEIKLAGLMHDIGKIGIDEVILNKPGALNVDEWDRIKQHSEIGYRILSSVNEFSKISKIVLHHHENFDGTGYPNGQAGEEISLGSRIIRITDSYDAMTGVRTYNNPLSKEEAIKVLKDNSGTQFDEALVELFVSSLD